MVERSNEVVILNPSYWADRSLDLVQLLRRGTQSGTVGDPTGKPPDPEVKFTIVDPDYWAGHPQALRDALRHASGTGAESAGGGALGAGAIGTTQERLTLTVEEAAQVLGISRAFAYESVRRGDIPHIKIGRRLLIPKVALDRLLASATAEDPDSPGS